MLTALLLILFISFQTRLSCNDLKSTLLGIYYRLLYLLNMVLVVIDYCINLNLLRIVFRLN